MRTIEVIVDPNGGITIDAIGFKGQACEKATEALAKALGTPGKGQHKPEWYQQNVGSQKVGR